LQKNIYDKMKKFTNTLTESSSTLSKMAKMIDYTFLKKNASIDEIKTVCTAAKDNKFHAICMMPDHIPTATAFVEKTGIKIVSVVSFPDGDKKTKEMVKDVNECITNGADEIDVVFNYKSIKKLSGKDDENFKSVYDANLDEITQITRLCHKNGVVLKVIVETGAITYEQLGIICDICSTPGVDYVMTSTGTLKNEETLDKKLDKVMFMRKTLPDSIKIKVSGGIYTKEDAMKFTNYVDRIGTSKVFIDF